MVFGTSLNHFSETKDRKRRSINSNSAVCKIQARLEDMKSIFPIFSTCLLARISCSLRCTSDIQKEIFSTLQKCSTVPTTINLLNMMQPSNHILQVIPSHVTASRCSGSCTSISHICQPTNISTMLVRVMKVVTQVHHGEHQLECEDVMVDTHEDCACGCEISPDDCLPGLQYHHQPSCRYISN